MGDMAEVFRDMTEADKQRRHANLKAAQKSILPWTKHTDVHWSLDLQGDRLDYWPTKNKFRWRNKTYHGGVTGFINKRMKGTLDVNE